LLSHFVHGAAQNLPSRIYPVSMALCRRESGAEMSTLYSKAVRINDQLLTSKWLRWYFGPALLLLLIGSLLAGGKVALYGGGVSVSALLVIFGLVQLLIGVGAIFKRDLLTGVFMLAFGLILVAAGSSFIIGLVGGAYA
jgi:hypothetical protein